MFIQSFNTVLHQVLMLFLLMGAGFAMQKAKLFGKDGITAMSNVLLWGATPCLLIQSFQREFDMELARSLMIFSICAAVAILAVLYITPVFFKKRYADEWELLSFACTFSNCGFMGIPLAGAVFGAEGAMYASIFVAIFNLLQWTFGFKRLSGKGVNLRKMIINPGVIGILIGVPLFIFSIPLPEVLGEAVGSIASLNTPLAMVVIGAHLAAAELKKALSDRRAFLVCLIRLIAAPLAGLALLWLLPIPLEHVPISVLLVEFAAPCGATTVLIGTMCGKDGELAGSCVALSTLFSLITLPLMISLASLLI